MAMSDSETKHADAEPRPEGEAAPRTTAAPSGVEFAPSKAPAAGPESSAGPSRPPPKTPPPGGAKEQAPGKPDEPPAATPRGRLARVRLFLKKHGHKFWWLHSIWALCLGIGVMLLARKGFEYLRWVATAMGGSWLLFLVFFRLYRSGARRKVEGKAAKVGFVAMTYVMKNMYQGMLFFLLPFYWNSSTFGSANFWFVVGLAVCALLSTLDVVFDNYVMRWRALASLLYLVTVFGCLNLVLPVLLPAWPVFWTLLLAAGLSAMVFLTLHIRLRFLVTRAGIVLTLVVMAVAISGAYAGRRAIPPVPYYLQATAAGTVSLADGRVVDAPGPVPAVELPKVVATTDVALPAGGNEPFQHIWRREGREIARVTPQSSRLEGKPHALRLRSQLPAKQLPDERLGEWVVDVETAGGQLVGRADFTVRR